MRQLHLSVPILLHQLTRGMLLWLSRLPHLTLLGLLTQHWLNLPIKHLPHQQSPSLHWVSFSSLSFFFWLTIDLEIAHPVEDALSNPFLLPQTPCRPPLSSVGAETFPMPSSVADTDDSSGLNDADSPRCCRRHLPTPPARKRGEPRVGRHSPTFRSSSSNKESGKNSKKARDVRTFFCARGDHNSCILCEYVCFLIFHLLSTKIFWREKHTLNPNYHVPRYSQKTSTATLHKHLYECHPDAWVAVCDKLGIDITAKGAQQVVREYRRRHGEFVPSSQDPEDLHQPFTQDAFVDALVDLIASEDLVSPCCYSRSLFIDYKTLTES